MIAWWASTVGICMVAMSVAVRDNQGFSSSSQTAECQDDTSPLSHMNLPAVGALRRRGGEAPMDEHKVETAAEAVKDTAVQTQAAAENASTAAQDASAAARQTTQAADTTARAAQTTATAAVITKDSAERRTELAGDRTVFAAERTYAAWVRTGLVGLAGGIGARALLEGLVPNWMALAQATVLMLFAIFCFIAGVWRQLFKVEPEAPDIDRLPGWVLISVNLFLALVAATALIGIWIGD